MTEYRLGSEWREARIYGETLADAVTREGKLQRPDVIANGAKVADGEVCIVGRVIGPRNTHGATRGGKTYESVLVELTDKRIVDVDALMSRPAL